MTREALWYQPLCLCWRLPSMLLVALLDTYDSALNKCTKYSCKVFLCSSYISSLFFNGLFCMKKSPGVLRLSAWLNKPCRKLDRLDKTHTLYKKDNAVYMQDNPDYYSDFTWCVPRNRRIMCLHVLHKCNYPKTCVYSVSQSLEVLDPPPQKRSQGYTW